MRKNILIFVVITIIFCLALQTSCIVVDGNLAEWNATTQKTIGDDGSQWYYTWDNENVYVGLDYTLSSDSNSTIVIYYKWITTPQPPIPRNSLDSEHQIPFEADYALSYYSFDEEADFYSYQEDSWEGDSDSFINFGRKENTWEFSFPREDNERVYIYAEISQSGILITSPKNDSFWGFLLLETTIPNLEGQIGTWPTISKKDGPWSEPSTWDTQVPDDNSFAYIKNAVQGPSEVNSFYILSGGDLSGIVTLSDGGFGDTEIDCCDNLSFGPEGSATIGKRGSSIIFNNVLLRNPGTLVFSHTNVSTLNYIPSGSFDIIVKGDLTYSEGGALIYLCPEHDIGNEWSNPTFVSIQSYSHLYLNDREVDTYQLFIYPSSSLTLTGSEGDDLKAFNISNNGNITLSEDGGTLVTDHYYQSSDSFFFRNSQYFGCPEVEFSKEDYTCHHVGSINATIENAFFEPLKLSWSRGSTIISTKQSISNLTPGIYQLTIEETGVIGGCPPIDPVVIADQCKTTTTGVGEIDFSSENGNNKLAIGLGIGIPLFVILVTGIILFILLSQFLRKKDYNSSPEEPQGEGDNEPVEMVPVVSEQNENFSSVKGVGIAFDQNVAHRRTMEDEHVAIDKFGGIETQGFFAIYDGHGGKEVAEFVVKKFHKNVLSELKKCSEIDPNSKEHPTITSALQKAYQITDEQIVENNITKSGATSAACFLRKNDKEERWLYSSNIGDARAVLCRDGKAMRLTTDHKATYESEVKRIKDGGGWVVQGKVAGILAVTRSFGDIELKQWVISEPYVSEVKLRDTDTYLIVACDGLWDVCSDQEAVDILLEHKEESAQKLSHHLLNFALKNKTKDNVSILVIEL